MTHENIITTDLTSNLSAGVLTLTMNRPDSLNAMSKPMLTAMLEVLREAVVNPEIRAVILTGAGRAFCAGGDVKAMAQSGQVLTPEANVQLLRDRMECSRLLHEMPKPTIAVGRGAMAGAGLSLALACDIRVVSDTLKLTSAFVKVGLSGDFGGSYFLNQLLGPRAREFVMLSPILNAEQALAMGLVSQVVPDAELDAVGRALAKRLADGPSITIEHIKANLNAAEQGLSLAQTLDHEAIRHIRSSMTEDHKEAARAFVEKRAPKFIHR